MKVDEIFNLIRRLNENGELTDILESSKTLLKDIVDNIDKAKMAPIINRIIKKNRIKIKINALKILKENWNELPWNFKLKFGSIFYCKDKFIDNIFTTIMFTTALLSLKLESEFFADKLKNL